MKIGIIGTGWLGTALATALLEKGNQVFGYSQSSPLTIKNPNYTHQTQKNEDTDFSLLEICVLAFPPGRETRENYPQVCLDYVRLLPAGCKVILISSTGVYPQEADVFTEEDTDKQTESNHLLSAENALKTALGNDLTIIRMAGLFGPNRYPVRFMSTSGKTYSGKDPVNLIHQTDAVGLIEFVLENKKWGETINGCSSEHPLKSVFYSEMAKFIGIEPPVFDLETGVNRIVSNEKSLKLGFRYVYDTLNTAFTF